MLIFILRYRFPLKSFSFMYGIQFGNCAPMKLYNCTASDLLFVIHPFFTLLFLSQRLNSVAKSQMLIKFNFRYLRENLFIKLLSFS